MEIVALEQGTPEWHEHRRKYFNASEAPAMLGVSSYKTRAELLIERKTGVYKEVSEAVKARFAEGHRAEALARAVIEEELIDDLYPAVCVDGKFSASLDGMTDDHRIGFEHKLLNKKLRDAMPEKTGWNTASNLPIEYRVQMEHQMLVSGVKAIVFTASEWDADCKCVDMRKARYESDPELRQRIIFGWKAFEEDLAKPLPVEIKQLKASAHPVEVVPSPKVTVTSVNGVLRVDAKLLDAWGEELQGFIDGVAAGSQREDYYTICKAAADTLKEAEVALKTAFDAGLAHIEGYTEIRDMVSALCKRAKDARLLFDGIYDKENKARKEAIIQRARVQFEDYLYDAIQRCRSAGGELSASMPDFAAAIKGKSSMDKIQDKVTATLISAKGDVELLEQQVKNNLALLDEFSEYFFLFFDKDRIVLEEDEKSFRKIVHERVNQYKKVMLERAQKQGPVVTPIQKTSDSTQKERSDVLVRPASGYIGMKKINTCLAPFTVNRYWLKNLGVSFISKDRQPMLTPEEAQDFCELCHQHIDYMSMMFAQNPDAIPELTIEELRDEANHWPFLRDAGMSYTQEEDQEEEVEEDQEVFGEDEEQTEDQEEAYEEDEDIVPEEEETPERKRSTKRARNGNKKR